MQTLTDIKSLLSAHGLVPKYRFGQNFLHDGNQMKKIIAAADIKKGSKVLEVGAGTGALSENILENGASLIAVEIDRDLEPILRDRFSGYGDKVEFIFEDVLSGKHEINSKVIDAIADDDFILVANLPYNTASALLANLAIDVPNMSGAVVMIQKEVADRLLAQPNSKNFGPLGIVIQALFEVEKVAVLSPSCFWPAPKVDSMVVSLIRRKIPLTDTPQKFSKFLHGLFSKRRKQIKAILSSEVALSADIEPTARPQNLSVRQLVTLCEKSQW